MTWENTPYELQRPGCLCYHDGKNRCTPSICPVHGWDNNPSLERLAMCIAERRSHAQSTADYVKRATAVPITKDANHELIYREALSKWGHTAQIDMAIEEAAELTQALMHHRRGRVTSEAVASEIADMTIMCGQLRLIFGAELVDAAIKGKLERLEGRLAA